MTRYVSCAETAKLVRVALNEKFSEQKFSVRSRTYSGGASITVRWFEGPATNKVDEVIQNFSGATFDGMIDLKEYHHSKLEGEEVQFGADFVFSERAYHDETRHKIAKEIAEKYGEEYTPRQWDIKRIGEEYLSTMVWRELQGRDLT